MVKLKAALIFAVIAALVIALAGLLKDVRFIVVGLRSVIGFLVAGLVAYIVVTLLEAKGIMPFDTGFETMADGTGETAEEGKGKEKIPPKDGEENAEEPPEEPQEEEGSEEAAFEPLDTGSLRHAQAPEP